MSKSVAYPEILTAANWTKAKGVAAKLFAKDTGLGDLLKKGKELYDKIDWTRFEFGSYSGSTLEAVEERLTAAKEHAKATIEPLRTHMTTVNEASKKVAQQYKDSKAIPESTCKHVEKLAEAATKLNLDLKLNSEFFTGVLKEYESRKKTVLELYKMLGLKAKKYCEEVKTVGTPLLKYVETFLLKKRGLAQEKNEQLRAQVEKMVEDMGPKLLTQFNVFRREQVRNLGISLSNHANQDVVKWYEENFKAYTLDSFDPKTVEEIPQKIGQIFVAVGKAMEKLN